VGTREEDAARPPACQYGRGAGDRVLRISVESGIPPFRGPGGLWSKYDPRPLEIRYFLAHPEVSWPILKEIFYDHFGAARPNRAHEVLAAWEARGLLKTVITQNIDSAN
jgi:NAD-dependent deacetylase